MFTVLLIAAFLALSGAVAVSSVKRRRNALSSGNQPKLLGTGSGHDLIERGLAQLRVGDIVQYDGRDFLVEGDIRYDEAGHRWSMSHIVDGKEDYWLLIGLERTGPFSKRLLRETTEIDLNDYPPETLVLGEDRFTFDKRGTATTELSGNTGNLVGKSLHEDASAHRCRWWNYVSGKKALVVEQWGDDYRFLVGEGVTDTDLEMLPAS